LRERRSHPAAGEGAPELEAGRVGRPHGLDGSFYVTAPRPRLLQAGASVRVAGRPRSIVRRAGTDRRPIVRLRGVEDRAAAEELRGRPLLVPADAAPELAEGEWWAHELEGCEVRDGRRRLGTVVRMIELPSCEVLEVAGADGGEPLLVPMVKDAVRRVDVENRHIEVDAEFLDLGAGPSSPPPGREGAR
jgi:16S rRNA processing protein RimM